MYFDDCGLGSDPNAPGPCTGSYGGVPGQASQAGKGAFVGVSARGPIAALLAAGVILVGVMFAVWVCRRVGRFFGEVRKRRAGDLRRVDSEKWVEDWEKRFDFADLGGRVSDLENGFRYDDALGLSVDAEEDREADTEDDGQDDEEQSRDNLNKGVS